MEQHLFLKGASGGGKSTLLLECISPYINEIGGFLTQRLLGDKNETVGFRLVPVQEALTTTRSFSGSLDHIFIEKTENGWMKHPQVFEETGVKLLSEAGKKKICFLDEIGGIELFAPEFKDSLYEFLEGAIPCLGVIKSSQNHQSMSKRVTVGKDEFKERNNLEQQIIQEFNGRIIEYSADHREEIKKNIQSFLNEHLREK